MAGLGFKDFAVGEVLTSADVDGYLMQQTVMRFADAGARGSALGTAAGTGVPLAEGMVTYLDSINAVQVYDGSVWTGVGKITQIVQTVKTDVFSASTAQGARSVITGLEPSITPTSPSSKVLVIAMLNVSTSSTATATYTTLLRDTSTAIGIGDAEGSRQRTTTIGSVHGVGADNHVIAFFDSPNTTSAVTYSVAIGHSAASSATVYANRIQADSNATNIARSASSITLIEIAA